MISVVVPSFAGASRLPRLLARFKRQATKRDWELVIVLDGTPDDSADVVRRHAEGLPVRVIDLSENRGRAGALNAGLQESRGEVLVRCDDDLDVLPDFVERHAGWHDDREVGVIGLTRDALPDTNYSRRYGDAAGGRARTAAYAREPAFTWMHWAANCSVSRAAWNTVGPYDEGFRGYGWEDVDWGYRLFSAGIPIIIDPRLETDHRAASTTTDVRLERAFRSGLARARFESKHGRALPEALPSTGRERAWAALVRAGSIGRTPAAYRRLGAVLERGQAVLPGALGTRAIAWGVEAASAAGRRGDPNSPTS